MSTEPLQKPETAEIRDIRRQIQDWKFISFGLKYEHQKSMRQEIARVIDTLEYKIMVLMTSNRVKE